MEWWYNPRLWCRERAGACAAIATSLADTAEKESVYRMTSKKTVRMRAVPFDERGIVERRDGQRRGRVSAVVARMEVMRRVSQHLGYSISAHQIDFASRSIAFFGIYQVYFLNSISPVFLLFKYAPHPDIYTRVSRQFSMADEYWFFSSLHSSV